MSNDSVKKTLLVATLLCVFCSIMVSSSVVILRPFQEENKTLDIRKNLLLAAGLIDNVSASRDEINRAYEKIEVRMINIDSGEYVDHIDPAKFDAKKAAKDPKMNKRINSSKDAAGIKTRSIYSKIFFVKENGLIDQIILPVYGKGLWSTMYGFLCLSSDRKTVKGFAFYDHGETPGLGGEVDNPRWKSLWPGKSVFDEKFNVIVDILKGSVNPGSKEVYRQVDGLAGATLTCNGVENLLHYWLGDDGFGPFLRNFSENGGNI
ncbi:MAG: Na(+)-translocating NADH-quinone reductase subunit C [Bacteriovoracaceae bacterium]|nr:Na(+)-translocating NADH-quinone reductase subunit C [Bacteriovoracaceae bacterium]